MIGALGEADAAKRDTRSPAKVLDAVARAAYDKLGTLATMNSPSRLAFGTACQSPPNKTTCKIGLPWAAAWAETGIRISIPSSTRPNGVNY